jgi:hypothetical protein
MTITERFKAALAESRQARFDRVVRREVESMKRKRKLGLPVFAKATDEQITSTAVSLAIIFEDKPFVA